MRRLVLLVNRPVIAIIAVGIIAAGVRFVHLSEPKALVFDEVYYAKAGCILVGWNNKTCMVNSSDEKFWRKDKWDVGSWVHPPLGKWEIALGEKAFGMTPFGWRVSSAVIGTGAVMALAGMAQVLWGSAVWTFVAGLLLATESLNVVESRAALLDIHLEFWVIMGFLFLVLDRRWIDRRTPPAVAGEPADPPPPDAPVQALRSARHVPSPIWRPWRFAAGAGFGLAVSVKWSGATAMVAAGLLALLWETTRRHRASSGWLEAFGRAFSREAFGLTLAFVLLPVAVYLIVYIPWFHHFGWSLPDWWRNRNAMWEYQSHLKATAYDAATKAYTPTHPYYSNWYTWPLMLRPISYWVKNGPNGALAQILAIGNPAIFWGTVAALPFTAWCWRRARDWRAGLIVVAALVQWLAWAGVSRPLFFFYVLPVTPFMVLACVYAVRFFYQATLVHIDPRTGERVESRYHPYRPVAWGFVLLAVGLFIWFWPVLTGVMLSHDSWSMRMWQGRWI
ncbi:MAG: phospholipid carrier-dependent glycosyltransferase [Actinomycetota bacterium]